MEIRQEVEADYPAVFELNRQAFGQDNKSQLVNALRQSKAFVPELSLVAEVEGEIVGHILFTKIRIGESDHESLALAPIAVVPREQRQGIGSALIKKGLAKATELGFDSVVVLGHDSFYPKFGFKPASNWNITTEYNSPDSTFALELKSGALTGVAGQVHYPKEFSIVS